MSDEDGPNVWSSPVVLIDRTRPALERYRMPITSAIQRRGAPLSRRAARDIGRAHKLCAERGNASSSTWSHVRAHVDQIGGEP
jgi:hypothetical protein